MQNRAPKGHDRTFIIPRTATLEGILDYPGGVTVDGTVLGDITCLSLVISERGSVDGTVKADKVTVLGEASGEIFANDLTLKAACSVNADINHRQLLLEDGSFFEGRSRRHANPLQSAG